jgi:hypothetical protein
LKKELSFRFNVTKTAFFLHSILGTVYCLTVAYAGQKYCNKILVYAIKNISSNGLIFSH